MITRLLLVLRVSVAMAVGLAGGIAYAEEGLPANATLREGLGACQLRAFRFVLDSGVAANPKVIQAGTMAQLGSMLEAAGVPSDKVPQLTARMEKVLNSNVPAQSPLGQAIQAFRDAVTL